MFHEAPLDTGEVLLHVATGPAAGPPLLCLHGVLRRWTDFSPLLPALVNRWQVLGLDFRGHGGSGFTPGNYLLPNYISDAAAVLRERATEPAVIYGHSLGAMTAAGVAAAIPDRVRAVILEDPPFHTMGSRLRGTPFQAQFEGYQRILDPNKDVEQLASELAELRIAVPGRSEAVRLGDLRDGCSLRWSARCLTQVDPDVLSPIVAGRWLDGYDWQAVIRQIHCPILLLHADEAAGGMLTNEDARYIAQVSPRCVTVRFSGIGHLIHWGALEPTLRVVLPFLESLR